MEVDELWYQSEIQLIETLSIPSQIVQMIRCPRSVRLDFRLLVIGYERSIVKASEMTRVVNGNIITFNLFQTLASLCQYSKL